MKNQNCSRAAKSAHRHQRILKRIRTGNDHYRLRITRTNHHIYAQLLDESDLTKSKTILSASSLQLKLPNGNKKNAALVAEALVKKMQQHQITHVAFDRGGAKYHGRIAVIADVLRANNIKV